VLVTASLLGLILVITMIEDYRVYIVAMLSYLYIDAHIIITAALVVFGVATGCTADATMPQCVQHLVQ